jgi:hypothetical protein
VEHVVALFCKDVAQLTPIHIVILKYRFLYRVFGSGSMHCPHALFKQKATEFNNKRKIGLLRPADTRMAGYFIALHRLLRLQNPLQAVQSSFEWQEYRFSSKDKVQKAAINAIITDPIFWHEVMTIVIAMFPVLRCLQLANLNAAGMDKIYYYARRTSESLQRTKHSFNGQNKRLGFEYRQETHIALGRSAVASRFEGSELWCLPAVEHCLMLDDDAEEDYVASFNCDDGEMEADVDDDASVHSYTTTGSYQVADTLRAGLGNHIVFLWEKRKPQLVSDFAVLGWLVSVVPEIRLDAKHYNGEQQDRAEQALRQLWYPMSAIEDDFQRNLNKFFSELGMFHNIRRDPMKQHVFGMTLMPSQGNHICGIRNIP